MASATGSPKLYIFYILQTCNFVTLAIVALGESIPPIARNRARYLFGSADGCPHPIAIYRCFCVQRRICSCFVRFYEISQITIEMRPHLQIVGRSCRRRRENLNVTTRDPCRNQSKINQHVRAFPNVNVVIKQ